ncbi:MAG TPA: outer membrane lipoprotein carrier protein LolA [Candidatus Polarisedimenticolia bacterium]|nr:outer membrane lipoprotein carrier protein LolA [Candidatus Polarisedimenticolia bacterium]
MLVLPANALPSSDAKATVHELEARYRGAQTLKAAFFERYTDGKGGVVAESGTVYFSRPGRMRWEYESPERKLFLVDGKNVWFYVPADGTASRAKLKESSDWRTPFALLAGKADLARLCREIQIADPSAEMAGEHSDARVPPGDTLLRCIPRGELDGAGDSTREILFEADPQARLVRVLIREQGNVETEFRFGNWQENIAIPEVKFHFQPPPGVAVVDEESLAGAIR